MGFKIDGLLKLSDDLYNLAKSVDGELIQDMLDAGAEVTVDEWKKAITDAGHIETGSMHDSVAAKIPKKNPNAREVYPQGTDKNGVRNAHKAYILNYGTSKTEKIAGDEFISKIYQELDQKVYDAEMKVYDEELKKRGL